MDGGCECSCHSEGSSVSVGPSRRSVLGVMAAAAVTLPMVGQAVRADSTTAPAEGSGDGTWVKTIKPADLADKTAKAITDDATRKTLAILCRDGKNIIALSSKCTHKGCSVNSAAGKSILRCPCHHAEFDFTGTNTRGPGGQPGTPVAATLKPLSYYALRLNSDGVIEVDTSKTVDKDAKEATLTVE